MTFCQMPIDIWQNMKTTPPDSFLPLNPRVFSLLVVLLDGPSHGYGIKLAVEERSGGQVTLDPGSLYRMISRLVDDGIIAESGARDAGGDPRRRYYELTALGREVVAEEARRLEGLLEDARSHLDRLGRARSTGAAGA